MDLFGDHSVQQAAQAALESAIVLTLATLLVWLSVRVARESATKPMLASVVPPAHARLLAVAGRDDEADRPSASRALGTSLPTRAPPAPPDPAQRFCPAPSGRLFSAG